MKREVIYVEYILHRNEYSVWGELGREGKRTHGNLKLNHHDPNCIPTSPTGESNLQSAIAWAASSMGGILEWHPPVQCTYAAQLLPLSSATRLTAAQPAGA